MTYLWIAIFGLIGVFCRYFLSLNVSQPYGTLVINIIGAFVIGIIYVLGNEKKLINSELTIGITTGLLGGFTTFSSYCLDTIKLIEKGDLLLATFYFIGTPLIGLLVCFIGVILGRKI
jgi:fluoride exporter